VHGIRTARVVPLVEVLELSFVLLDDVRIEQLAQLGIAEQLAQLRVIDRQRLRPPFGQRGVAVVEEARDVPEQQRRGEGRGLP